MPGILNWALAGLAEWQRDGGLQEPEAIRRETQRYRENSDLLRQWLAARTEGAPGERVRSQELYQDYRQHCFVTGLRAMSHVAWTRKLEERGFEKVKDGRTRQSQFVGLRLQVNP